MSEDIYYVTYGKDPNDETPWKIFGPTGTPSGPYMHGYKEQWQAQEKCRSLDQEHRNAGNARLIHRSVNKQIAGDHYKKLAIQPAEYCQKNKLGYCESLAIKYITRHRDKNGAEDIDKAIHCLELLKGIEYEDNL